MNDMYICICKTAIWSLFSSGGGRGGLGPAPFSRRSTPVAALPPQRGGPMVKFKERLQAGRDMALKKLSDPYTIRSNASITSVSAGASPSTTATAAIDTGLDALRQEVLAIWAVQFGVNASDDGQQMLCALQVPVAAIQAGSIAEDSVKWGTRMQLNKEAQGLIEDFADPEVIAFDSQNHEAYLYDAGSNSARIVTTTSDWMFPESYDPNEPGVPLAYVTSSSMEFVLNSFIDGQTTSSTYGGITGSVRILAQRMKADAALYAAILTGNQ